MLKKIAAVVGMVVGMGACGVAEAQTVQVSVGVIDNMSEFGGNVEFGDGAIKGYGGASYTHDKILYFGGVRIGGQHFLDWRVGGLDHESIVHRIGYGYRKSRFNVVFGVYVPERIQRPAMSASVGFDVFR